MKNRPADRPVRGENRFDVGLLVSQTYLTIGMFAVFSSLIASWLVKRLFMAGNDLTEEEPIGNW